ncbi:MAG TPA: MFS transporter [Candidatus Acidoferrales bacterium]|nr:MFS transporter [Candidatus Acidoferrales bacterium]
MAGTEAAGLAGGASDETISDSRRWFIVWLLFVASFINYLDRGAISVALPRIAHDLHLGPERKGVLLSAFFWSYALMQIPVGWASDRLNLRWLYAGLFLLWSLSQGLTGLAAGLGMLILFRTLLGVGESIYLPGGTKIVSMLFVPRARGFPTGLFDCGIRAGLAFGTPLTAVLIERFGWRHMFLILGLTALLWLPPWLAAFPSRLPQRAWPGAAPAGGATPKRGITMNRNLLGICLGFFCFDYYWYLFVTWLPDYLVTARHMKLMAAGLYAALPYVVFTIGEPAGGWIADALVRRGWNETRTRKTIITAAYLTGLLLIPAMLARSNTRAIWLIAAASLVGFSAGNLLVLPACCAPHDEVGLWAGFENFAGNVAGVIAPLATGLLIARTGSYFAGFALGAVVLVAGILAYWFVVGELEFRAREPG